MAEFTNQRQIGHDSVSHCAHPDVALRLYHVVKNVVSRFNRQGLPGGEAGIGRQTRAVPHTDHVGFVGWSKWPNIGGDPVIQD